MGTGEDAMRIWGYSSSSLCLVSGLISLIACIFMLVLVKSDTSDTFKSNAQFLAIITMIVSIVAMVIGGVAVWKIYLANQLYLQVSSEAASGKIGIAANKSGIAKGIASNNSGIANATKPKPQIQIPKSNSSETPQSPLSPQQEPPPSVEFT